MSALVADNTLGVSAMKKLRALYHSMHLFVRFNITTTPQLHQTKIH